MYNKNKPSVAFKSCFLVKLQFLQCMNIRLHDSKPRGNFKPTFSLIALMKGQHPRGPGASSTSTSSSVEQECVMGRLYVGQSSACMCSSLSGFKSSSHYSPAAAIQPRSPQLIVILPEWEREAERGRRRMGGWLWLQRQGAACTGFTGRELVAGFLGRFLRAWRHVDNRLSNEERYWTAPKSWPRFPGVKRGEGQSVREEKRGRPCEKGVEGSWDLVLCWVKQPPTN